MQDLHCSYSSTSFFLLFMSAEGGGTDGTSVGLLCF